MQLPLYDRVIVPCLRRVNLAPSYLQRIGIGLIVSPTLAGRLFLPHYRGWTA